MSEDWSSKKERCGSGGWELRRHSFSLQGFMVTIQMRFHRSQWELVICKSVWSQELQLHYILVCIFKCLFSCGNNKHNNIIILQGIISNLQWQVWFLEYSPSLSSFCLTGKKKCYSLKTEENIVVLAMFPVYWHERNGSFKFQTK